MPTFVLFITLATFLAVLLAFIVLIPWLRADRSAQNNQLIALNVEVFQQRIAELQADYADGKVDETAFKQQKTELERQLLQANEDEKTSIGGSHINQSVASETTDNDAEKTTKNLSSQVTQSNQFTQSSKARLTILICVPLLMGLGYAMAADRTAVTKLWQGQDALGQVADDLVTGKIDMPPKWATTDSVALLNAIQTNVHHNAHDPQRWMHLAEVYLAFEAHEPALESLARAYRLAPTDETIAVRYAQTQFFTSNGSLNQDSYQALQSVLQSHPNHQGAQMLMAMGEARAGNYDEAQGWIDKLRTGISQREGDHSAALASLDELSANIKSQASQVTQTADDSAETVNSKNSASITNPAVVVAVSLNPSLQPLIESSDTLFVSIKEASGGAPLAVKKLTAGAVQLTNSKGIEIKLSDNDAMMPNHTLSSAMDAGKSLVVTARISKSGQAITQTGDLQSNVIPLDYSLSQQTGSESEDEQNSDNAISIAVEINQQVL